MNLITARVTRRSDEALGIVSLELRALAGRGELPPFSPGSHVDVHIAPGLVRPYSLCNDPAESGRYVIAVLREPDSRGGSAAVHDRLHEGDIIEISAPKNNFPLVAGCPALLVAGGIGITPLLSMAWSLARSNAGFGLHYCSRSPERAAFRHALSHAPFASNVHFHFDNADEQQKLKLPQVLAACAADTHLYVCGPSGFISAVLDAAQAQGWAPDRLHREYFSKQADPDAHPQDQPFELVVASSGLRIPVAAGESAVAALTRHGIEVPVACEQGICGTCVTRVLAGEPDHRDMYFTKQEHALNDQFTPCCSRARTPVLVLDL